MYSFIAAWMICGLLANSQEVNSRPGLTRAIVQRWREITIGEWLALVACILRTFLIGPFALARNLYDKYKDATPFKR